MLSSLRILDLTSNLPGPFATMLLADLGAEVIKIERPPDGDPLRSTFLTPSGQAVHFQAVNRHKRSLSLNLASPAGREIFLRLLDDHDIVVEGFRPGVMDRLGLGYETLRRRQPRLIYLALTGFGLSGPLQFRAGHDLNYLALAGAAALTGTPEGELTPPGLLMADLGGGAGMALFGLLAAAAHRQQSGQGVLVDVSMFDGLQAWLGFCAAGVFAGQEEGRPGGTFPTGRYPCYGIYKTSDGGFMTLGALEPHFWARFCRAVGREDLTDQAFAGPEVVAQVRAVFASRTKAEWIEVFREHDCCCEPVLSPEEAKSSPQAKARGMFPQVEVRGERLTQVGCPVKFPGRPPRPPAPAPDLGQHNREILTELGYSAREISALEEQGVL